MCKILLVDDDNELRPLLASVLDTAGYNVIPCSTVSEARQLYKEHGIELAILDDTLPNGQGIELARGFSRDGTSIIMMGNPTQEEVHNALMCGVGMFLNKPFDEEDLVTIVDRTMKQDKGSLPSSLYTGGGGRQIGDEVSMQTLFSKVSAMSSRHREMTDDILFCKGAIADIAPSLKLVIQRTSKCEERGEKIAVLEERSNVSKVNWERVATLAVGLIEAGLAAYLARVISQLP
jgi:DNA-binding response OmpR family regulator